MAAKTALCEDCGTRVQVSLGSDPRCRQGVRTTSGTYICGECMGVRHTAPANCVSCDQRARAMPAESDA